MTHSAVAKAPSPVKLQKRGTKLGFCSAKCFAHLHCLFPSSMPAYSMHAHVGMQKSCPAGLSNTD